MNAGHIHIDLLSGKAMGQRDHAEPFTGEPAMLFSDLFFFPGVSEDIQNNFGTG